MEDTLIYLFAGFAVIWAAVLIYAFSLARRQRDLQQEVEALREALEAKEKKEEVAVRN